MFEAGHQEPSDKRHLGWKKTFFISGAILLLATLLVIIIFSTEPTAKRTGATKETAMLVETTLVEQGSFHPTIVATGTVTAAQDIILSPRVSGEIIRRAPGFSPGGIVEKGEILLQIDPADYEIALLQRKSELEQTLAELNLEMGQQNIAQKDYQLYDQPLSARNKALVLREPQLNTAQARVDMATAAVEQAELELKRTTIRAPFDAHILSRNANVGSQVSPGDNLGRLVGRDIYWIETTVPVSKLRWLRFPNKSGMRGSEVKIRNRTAWTEQEFRLGYLYKLVGALESQTRMAIVLVSVKDPLAYRSESENQPKMILGSFVETRIKGKEISNIIRLDRDYVRKNDTVWVMQDSILQIRNVDILLSDERYAYISDGLSDNEHVVTTNLATVVQGAKLRLASSDTTSDRVSLSAVESQKQVQPKRGAS